MTEAIDEFQVSLGIAARLAASDPSNAAWRRDLYASYRNLGLAQERGAKATSAADVLPGQRSHLSRARLGTRMAEATELAGAAVGRLQNLGLSPC